MNALLLGGIAAVPSYFGLIIRAKTSLDDSLDVVAAHGVGGTVGALLTGVFAEKALNGLADGALYGNPGQLAIQATAILAAIVYSGVVTFILLKVVGLVHAAARDRQRRERGPRHLDARRRGLPPRRRCHARLSLAPALSPPQGVGRRVRAAPGPCSMVGRRRTAAVPLESEPCRRPASVVFGSSRWRVAARRRWQSLITSHGGQPRVAPSMREVPLESNAQAVAFAEALVGGAFDIVVLLTGVGTRVLLDVVERAHGTRTPFVTALAGSRWPSAGRNPWPSSANSAWSRGRWPSPTPGASCWRRWTRRCARATRRRAGVRRLQPRVRRGPRGARGAGDPCARLPVGAPRGPRAPARTPVARWQPGMWTWCSSRPVPKSCTSCRWPTSWPWATPYAPPCPARSWPRSAPRPPRNCAPGCARSFRALASEDGGAGSGGGRARRLVADVVSSLRTPDSSSAVYALQ